jgi:hypothetical protein
MTIVIKVCDPVVVPKLDHPFSLPLIIFALLLDAFRFVRLSLQPCCILAAEVLLKVGIRISPRCDPQ